MAISATFYSLSKKENSTARPTSGSTFSISIKDRTSALNPVITLNTNQNPVAFNYCYIPTFNRFYWVTDWIFDSGIWSAYLRADVLATYKDAIGTSTQYVKRAYSQLDTDIIDVYPRKAGTSVLVTTGSTGLQSNLSSMLFVLGVTSASATNATIGTTVYYGLSFSQIKNFIAHLVSMSYNTFTDITDNLAKWLCDPFQWLKSVVVFPFTFGNVTGTWGSTTEIQFGADENGTAFSYAPGGSVYIISSAAPMTTTFTLTVPKHPDIDAQHNYLQAEPFSNYSAIIPPFGKVSIPSAILYNKSELHCLIRVDPVTGGGSLYIGESNTHYGDIILAESQVGVSLPLDAAIVDLASAGYAMLISGGANAVDYAVNNGGGNLEGILTSFIDGALSSVSRVQTISTGGKLCDLGLSPLLFLEYFTIIGQDPENYGYPLGQRVQINSLSGFVLCDNAEISIANATFDEMRSIESYMNSGFFFE